MGERIEGRDGNVRNGRRGKRWREANPYFDVVDAVVVVSCIQFCRMINLNGDELEWDLTVVFICYTL